MNRRTAVRNIVVISAGASLLPACTTSPDVSSLRTKNFRLTGSQESMLAVLSETIIPKTNNFAGASDLESYRFVVTMIRDCASPEEEKSFIDGMKAFEDACKKKFDTSFIKCTPQQKNDLLKEMEAGKDDNAAKFYKTVKRYTIQSFTSSKDYLLNVKKWKMVPGPVFKGCIPVNA